MTSPTMDSDEDDTFVTIGTPLEPLDEDEVPKRAPALQDQTVKDKRGRQRFHGAFTGGFSAGFFNTVGSKEGFTPQTFVSSRSQRPGTGDGQRPEDFMDEDDLGEFGIAPKKISASDDFASLSALKKRCAPTSERSTIPDFNLEDLVLPSKVPMGMRLLKKMGWKEGQGVGPRTRKKKKKKKELGTGTDQPGTKVYGCAFKPPDGDDSSSNDDIPQDVTFAPKDTSPFTFNPKDNLHGIGYRGLDPKAALHGHVNLFEAPAPLSKSGKKGISGHAFGVGALNDEDDDVYSVHSMIGYDRELTDEADTSYGWTAPKHALGSSRRLALTQGPDNIGKALEGFTLSSTSLKQKKTFPPPPLPRDFRPIHVFKKPVDILGMPIPSPPDNANKRDSQAEMKLDANTRGALLGEKSLIGSVFDLVSDKDKEKIKAAKDGTLPPAKDGTLPPAKDGTLPPAKDRTLPPAKDRTLPPEGSPIKAPIPGPSVPSSQPKDFQPASSSLSSPSDKEKLNKGQDQTRSSWREVTSPTSFGNARFKPFEKDPEKQVRYEQYLDAQKHGRKYTNDDLHLTEWEREHEMEEFAKAAKLYRPLSMMIASRFTRGKYDDSDTVEVVADEAVAKSDQAKAAEMKMYGKMTREVIKWHPDKLLCRRFNVANPYPDSSQVGSQKVKRDKFSVFNFLNVPKAKEEKQSSPPRAIKFKEDPPPPVEEEPKESTRPAVSFVIGMAKKKDNIEITKEEALGQADPEQMEEDDGDKDVEKDKQKAAPSEEERPPMDLFKAIFEASDSSSSSSSSDEEEKKEETEQKEDKIDDTQKQSQQSDGQRMHRFLLPSQRRSRWDPIDKDVPMDTTNSSQLQGAGTSKDSDSVCEKMEQSSASELLPSATKLIEDRLGFGEKMDEDSDEDIDEEVYGPMPPQVSVISEESSSKSTSKKDRDKHRKKKHKHKDKHKHKKKKDKKDKKSKHKKKKKHKDLKDKHKKKASPSSSSGSEANSDSSDEGEPSTRDLLTKIHNLPGKRLKAADFM